ncbi:hypothetical protein [Bacteroides sp. 51]|uniref:hypothetical protein n=1 Tax=Bacteroides sp. 51 TaxID=2302938 RepID=UPI0013D27CFF|nr:hypothetical protein [Bacteroides sp. 51]NDV80772.1 hypothetical protein [Bacteroides sp. 51]
MEIKLHLPSPGEFERYYEVPTSDFCMDNGIYLIGEMKTSCFDFGPFDRTIEDLLKASMFADEEPDKITKLIEEQCEFFAEHLGVVYYKYGIQQAISISALTESIKSELMSLVSEWRCTEEETQTIHKQLVERMITDSDFIAQYKQSYTHQSLNEVAESVAIYITGGGRIERYFLDKKYQDVSWQLVGNKRIMDMDEVWSVFCETLKGGTNHE